MTRREVLPYDAAIWTEVGRLVVEHVDPTPVAVIAFGSRALGFATASSDFDVYGIADGIAADGRLRARLADAGRTDLGVTLDLHGASPAYVERFRAFEPELNAALRAGKVLHGDTSRWKPVPPLGAVALADVCVSMRLLSEDAHTAETLRYVRRRLLLTQTLADDVPDWESYYGAVRRHLHRPRAGIARLLSELELRRAATSPSTEDRRLLAVVRS